MINRRIEKIDDSLPYYGMKKSLPSLDDYNQMDYYDEEETYGRRKGA